MKRFVLLLGLCIALTSCSQAEEFSSSAGAINPTDEINSSFSQSKNTNWLIHRMKPKSNVNELSKQSKKQEPKQSIFDRFNSDDKLIKQINENDKKINGVSDWADINKGTGTNEKVKTTDIQAPKKKVKTDIKEVKPASENVNKTDINPPKQTKTEEKKLKQPKEEIKKEPQKETVHTTTPAEKVIDKENKQAEKEEKIKLNQEEEKEKYRELQALTQQYQQAVALYTDNNLDESLAVFSQIPEDKRPAEAWLLMGNILMDKEKKDEAIFMYGRAILTDSKFYKAYYNLGNIYLADEKLNMAVDQYKSAAKYAPNNAYVYYNLGCAYLKLGELKKAKSAFIRAVELNNKIADFHYNLAYVYKKLGKEKMAKTYLDNYNKLTGQVD